MFSEFVKEITKELEAKESRNRARGANAQISFNYAVGYILKELWRNALSYPPRESSINLRSGYYSELERYRDPLLTYRQVKAAHEGLIACRYIEVTTKGYFSREKGTGGLTRLAPTDRLLERFENLEGHPAFVVSPNLDLECIILRDKLDGSNNTDIPYTDTPKTERFRNNLKTINECLIKHWADLRIKDSEVEKLAQRVLQDPDKEPIDLSRRILTRIFSNGSFDQGGRFYRGWWQNVPSEYRPYITIDSKATSEHDYSQLNPNMIYSAYNKELGSEDAYSRVAGEEHRDVVKQAFNAMFQASTTLDRKPDGIELDAIGMSWRELKEEILNAHKPIKDYFFKGLGNRLQFEDSIIAESIMLHFAKMDAPALPIHDSFVMHHGYGDKGGLEEAMRRAYFERFNSSLSEKRDLVEKVIHDKIRLDEDKKPINNSDGTIEVDDIINAESEYSQWRDRDRMWMSRKWH